MGTRACSITYLKLQSLVTYSINDYKELLTLIILHSLLRQKSALITLNVPTVVLEARCSNLPNLLSVFVNS